MAGTLEVDGYEVSLGEELIHRAETEHEFLNALRIVVKAVKECPPRQDQVLLSVALAKLTNMNREQLATVSVLEDIVDPTNIRIAYPYGKDKPGVAYDDTPENREAMEELAEGLKDKT